MEDHNTAPPKIEGHLNNPSGAVVNVARELLDKLRADVTTAELRTQQLREELEAERAKTEDDRVADLVALVAHLKEIVDHHCANLSPEFIRDMPAEAISGAAFLVQRVAGATQRDQERGAVWFERAKDILDWRRTRADRELATMQPAAAPSRKAKAKTKAKRGAAIRRVAAKLSARGKKNGKR